MPVDKNNYDHRGSGNYGIVVRCPNLVGDRLVYFDYNAQRGSWVVRDGISGLQLSNHESHLTVADIEADADYDEFPPYYNATNLKNWAGYLRLRTMAAFKLRSVPNIDPPKVASGRWLPL